MSQHNPTSNSENQQSSSKNQPENEPKKRLHDLPKSEIDNFFTKLTASQKQELVKLTAEECHTRMQLLYEQHEENSRKRKIRDEIKLDDKCNNSNTNKKKKKEEEKEKEEKIATKSVKYDKKIRSVTSPKRIPRNKKFSNTQFFG